jgi:quaternary ammonium compound-resistance protein SugE
MAWVLLIVAGLCETAWVVMLKYGKESERWWPTLVAFGVSIVSFLLMDRVLVRLPVGTSYAVWTGIGAVGAAVLGIVLFRESISPIRLACVIGLKLTSPG